MSNVNKQKIAYIHIHSRKSIKDSFSSMKDYMKKISKYNDDEDAKFEVIGLSATEHGNISSLVDLHNATKGTEIKPLYGCEVYHTTDRLTNPTKRYHLVLIAKTQEGLSNLYQIVSDAGVNAIKTKAGNMFTLSEEQAFQKWGKGIIATSACLGGRIPKLLMGDCDRDGAVIEAADFVKAQEVALRYASYFDDFYLEVQPQTTPEQLMLNAEIVRLSKATGIPLVMGIDAHYVEKNDKQYHDILKDIARQVRYDSDNYLFEPEVLEQYCIDHDIPMEALENTAKIAESCQVDPKPKDSRGLLPEFPVPVGYTENGYLRELCNDYLMDKISKNEIADIETYITRMNYELETICAAGFAGYFLILWDWFKWCRENDILMGKGRG